MNPIGTGGIVGVFVGVVLLGFAFHASNASVDQLSNTLTDRSADRTVREAGMSEQDGEIIALFAYLSGGCTARNDYRARQGKWRHVPGDRRRVEPRSRNSTQCQVENGDAAGDARLREAGMSNVRRAGVTFGPVSLAGNRKDSVRMLATVVWCLCALVICARALIWSDIAGIVVAIVSGVATLIRTLVARSLLRQRRPRVRRNEVATLNVAAPVRL